MKAGQTLFLAGLLAIQAEATAAGGQINVTAVRTLLEKKCADCHRPGGMGDAAIRDILNYEDLIAKGIVVPKVPEASPLYLSVKNDRMPLDEPSLEEKEKSALENWIREGAPNFNQSPPNLSRPIVDHMTVYDLVTKDLERQRNELRPYLRYVTLAHLHNRSVAQKELDLARQSIGKLLNSVSWQKAIALPVPIDEAKLIYRFNLNDFGISSALWERISKDDVFASFPMNERTVQKLRRLTGTHFPIVRGDWFVTTAMEPTTYSLLLDLPTSIPELEQRLGVFSSKGLMRSGFSKSGISRFNRLIERHETRWGYYWKSFDFSDNNGEHDIFANPFGGIDDASISQKNFQASGGEFIFSLPNGFQGYMLADGEGRRLDEAPLAIVTDRLRPEVGVVRNGISCISCHRDGLFFKADELGPFIAREAAFSDQEKAWANQAHPRNDVLQRRFDRDNAIYGKALAQTKGQPGGEEPLYRTERSYSQDLDLAAVLGEIGIDERTFSSEDVQAELKKSLEVESFFLRLRELGQTVKRLQFEQIYPKAIKLILGLSYPESPGATLALSSGGGHSCAVDLKGVKCWGDNRFGQSTAPLVKNPVQLSLGENHSCALGSDGVICWGDNRYGQTKVPRLVKPTEISSGTHHTCAIDQERVKCWGRGDSGQTRVPRLQDPVQVSAGGDFTCALDRQGVKCWGSDSDGQLQVSILKDALQVSAGFAHACSISEQQVKCWGNRSDNRTLVPAMARPTQISSGSLHSCALDQGTVKCWGSSTFGQTTVPAFGDAEYVSAGGHHTCAKFSLHGVKCWGRNDEGQTDPPELNF